MFVFIIKQNIIKQTYKYYKIIIIQLNIIHYKIITLFFKTFVSFNIYIFFSRALKFIS
jgi:hypothetical protein